MRKQGLWHFDTAHEEPNAYRLIARVAGDLERLEAEVPPGLTKVLSTSMAHRPASDPFLAAIQAGNEADAGALGLHPDMEYASVFDAKGATAGGLLADRLTAKLPLDDAYWKLHRQAPGQVWPVHFDNYHALRRTDDVREWEDPGVRRLWIMLTDWQWGQFVQLGNFVWSHWRAGDVMFFDWLVPHGSANCGHATRSSLLVTGRSTAELRRWVADGELRVLELR